MTDETISSIINLINTGNLDFIFLRPLSEDVLFGRVWIQDSQGTACTDSGYMMFFIQNSSKNVVAAVLDMGVQDLHVYVEPSSRGMGYLSNALRATILPFIFTTGRLEQRITFESEEAMHHAELVGFQILSETSAVMTPGDIPPTFVPPLSTIPPTETQLDRIKKRISTAADLLRMARDDIETAFGEDEVWEDLDDLSHHVSQKWWMVRDMWQDNKQSTRTSKQV